MAAACTGIASEAYSQVINLGAAESYAVLGGSAVTSTGPTTISGDVGVSPGTSITQVQPIVVTGGSIHYNDASAIQAHLDAEAAYTTLAALPFDQDLTGQDLGGLTLTPGVYNFDFSAQLTGILTLDGQGQTNPLFVFQTGSTLTTAPGASIVWTNGEASDNLYFQVGSSATLDDGTQFAGTIIADQSITLNSGASVDGGRLLAVNAAVTLINNNIQVVPEPSSSLFALAGLTLMLGRRRRRAAADASLVG